MTRLATGAVQPPHDHAGRVAALRAALAGHDVDALVVTSPANVRYLTGFTGSNGAVLVPTDPQDDVLLATDARYATQADTESPGVPVLIERSCARGLVEQAAGRGLVRLGFEPDHVSVALHEELWRAATTGLLVPVRGAVEALRVVKDPTELAALRTACEISVAALEGLLADGAWSGRTERDLAAELELRMRRLGAEAVAFPTILGSGPASAVPHHRPGGRELRRGDLVVVDFGARVDGYHADLTRTFVVGPPADWQRDLVDLVASAQQAARSVLAPGVACSAVDHAARGIIEQAGHGARFGHGTGHGVGLEIHEAPGIGAGAEGMLAAEVAVTIEPGVYLPDRGGVRIEDTMVVTHQGATALTSITRELRVLD